MSRNDHRRSQERGEMGELFNATEKSRDSFHVKHGRPVIIAGGYLEDS